MEEILIDDGSKEYSFKNHLGETFATFAFNPTDAGLLSRYDKAIEFFQKVKYPEDATIEDIVALENGIKEQFNLVCGKNVSDGLFGRYTPLTLFANGEMYCEIAIEKIGDFIEKELSVRIEKKKVKIKKDLERRKNE